MKIKLQRNLTVACTDGVLRECKPGDVVSVYHASGRNLLYRRLAVWVGREPFDPLWDPPALMKAVAPERDKMMRGAMNKGAA